jgi:GNAT superfamily N-acetyltransferase
MPDGKCTAHSRRVEPSHHFSDQSGCLPESHMWQRFSLTDLPRARNTDYDRCHHLDTTDRDAMPPVHVVHALATGRMDAAREVTFEYLALTQARLGCWCHKTSQACPRRCAVSSTCSSSGTVALARSSLTRATDAVLQRLYVRAAHRRRGIARELVAAVHAIALREGFDRTVLNVMSSRAGARALDKSLGYRTMTERL